MRTLALAANGWITGIRHHKSPNYTPRPAAQPITLVVIHGISLPPREFGSDAVEQLFSNTLNYDAHPYYDSLRAIRVSAHFFIRRSGELIQFVSTADCAWHAGKSYWRNLDNCNDFSLGIELEGCDDMPYEKVQYDKLIALLKTLARHYPGLAVAGHSHIAPQRKTDPGEFFDWQLLFAQLGNNYDGRPAA